MKLDASDLRFLTADEFRILTAVRVVLAWVSFSPAELSAHPHASLTLSLLQTEMGSKNHEVVPASLIAQISGIRSGGGNKLMGQLARRNLIARVQNVKCGSSRWLSLCTSFVVD